METIRTSPLIQQSRVSNDIVQLLIAAGIKRQSHSILDYERSKRIITDLNSDADTYEHNISVAANYIGV